MGFWSLFILLYFTPAAGFELEGACFDEAWRKRQASVRSSQGSKIVTRDQRDYSNQIFRPNGYWRGKAAPDSGVQGFLAGLSRTDPEKIDLKGFLEGFSRARGRPVRWTDMGSGMGIPSRELHRNPSVVATRVDMVNWEEDARKVETLIEDAGSAYVKRILEEKPNLVLDDMTTVRLAQPQDVISSIESFQYAEDKLAAIANWYNQLEDNGVLILVQGQGLKTQAMGKSLKARIRAIPRPDDPYRPDLTSAHDFKVSGMIAEEGYFARALEGLRDRGIQVVTSTAREGEKLEEATVIVIQRKPGTRLRPMSRFREVIYHRGYPTSVYEDINPDYIYAIDN